jgi:hypothetical protein
MRWKVKPSKPEPEHGDLRVVSKFLFFPLRIDDRVRWLEKTEIVQKYVKYRVTEYPLLFGRPFCYITGRWENLGFAVPDEADVIEIKVDKDDPYNEVYGKE